MKRFIITVALLTTTTFPVLAQFHRKSGDGKTSYRQMHNPYSRRPASPNGAVGGYEKGQHLGFGTQALQNSSIKRGNQVHAVVINPHVIKNGRKDTGNPHLDAKAGTMSILEDADVWGRARNHPDGTYTETVFDNDLKKPRQLAKGETNVEAGYYKVYQRTRKPSLEMEDPIILTREIFVDHLGFPRKVNIYGGDEQLRFRGLFIYDSGHRMTEEHVFNHNQTFFRRTIYPYENGQPLPRKVIDYTLKKGAWDPVPKGYAVANDLVDLIEARENETIVRSKLKRLEEDVKSGKVNLKEKKRTGLLGKKQQQTATPAAPTNHPTPFYGGSVTPQPEKKKPFRFFKR